MLFLIRMFWTFFVCLSNESAQVQYNLNQTFKFFLINISLSSSRRKNVIFFTCFVRLKYHIRMFIFKSFELCQTVWKQQLIECFNLISFFPIDLRITPIKILFCFILFIICKIVSEKLKSLEKKVSYNLKSKQKNKPICFAVLSELPPPLEHLPLHLSESPTLLFCEASTPMVSVYTILFFFTFKNNKNNFLNRNWIMTFWNTNCTNIYIQKVL